MQIIISLIHPHILLLDNFTLGFGGHLQCSSFLQDTLYWKITWCFADNQRHLDTGINTIGGILCFTIMITSGMKDMTHNSKNLFKLNIVNGNIQFSNVTFNYPSRPDVRVLRGIDFKVSDGQKVALVGSSGCGKSTIVKLLLKLYDCDDGQVSNSVNNYYYICA